MQTISSPASRRSAKKVNRLLTKQANCVGKGREGDLLVIATLRRDGDCSIRMTHKEIVYSVRFVVDSVIDK